MNELHLFAGAGGGILGGILLGHRCVCAVEINSYCQRSLIARQRDGTMPHFPVWDDVTTFKGEPWRPYVDIVCAGFPCQDISQANTTAVGIEGERSSLYREAIRIVREVGPQYVWLENSPALSIRGLGTVLKDLAEMGFDAEWGVLGADAVGAPHERKRIWILAYAVQTGFQERNLLPVSGQPEIWSDPGRYSDSRLYWPPSEPPILRNTDGVAKGLGCIEAAGNGQVPAVAELAWKILHAQSLMK